MNVALKYSPKSWRDLQQELTDQLQSLEETETDSVVMTAKAIQVCASSLDDVRTQLCDYVFSEGEEVEVYKHIKPFFLGRFIFYKRRLELEQKIAASTPGRLESISSAELDRLEEVYERNDFMFRYLKSNSTQHDKTFFFHYNPNSSIALYGLDLSPALPFPVCYDNVVANLIAADLMKAHLERTLLNLQNYAALIASLPKLTWTDTDASSGELQYVLYAGKVFNNGNATLTDIHKVFAVVFNSHLNNPTRMRQESIWKKEGPHAAIMRWIGDDLERISKLDQRHMRF